VNRQAEWMDEIEVVARGGRDVIREFSDRLRLKGKLLIDTLYLLTSGDSGRGEKSGLINRKRLGLLLGGRTGPTFIRRLPSDRLPLLNHCLAAERLG
jgi:hypothetical protein